MSETRVQIAEDALRVMAEGGPQEAFQCSNIAREILAELTRLRAEVARLREALTPFAQPGLMKSHPGAMRNDSAIYGRDNATLRLGDFRRARAALFPAPATDPQGVDRG